MKRRERIIFLLFLIITLNKCIQPPNDDSLNQIIANKPELFSLYNNNDLSLKNPEKSDENAVIANSSVTITYYEEYQTLEHQIILVPQNLPENQIPYSYTLRIYTYYKYINNTVFNCEILSTISNKICRAFFEKKEDIIDLSIYGSINKGDTILINYKYDGLNNNTKKLLKEEIITIPLVTNHSPIFCNFKYIIPEGYIFLGTRFNNIILTKESETTYSYYGPCPKDLKIDKIRYSPETVSWKSNVIISLFYPHKFTNNVIIIFPEFFYGGKYTNNEYIISSLDNDDISLKKDTINNTLFYKVVAPAVNKEEVGVKINITFTNKLTADFKMFESDHFYEINLSAIDQEIIDKATEIIKEESDKPDYYKIGKFVNNYLTYDNNSGLIKDLTLKEIYDGKRGNSLHYTLLYNAMLNSIGIKTLSISGLFIHYSNMDIIRAKHFWTVALINGNWMELDATLGFFEGITAGHIMITKDVFAAYPLGEEKNEISNKNFKQSYEIEVIEINPRKKLSTKAKILIIILIISVLIILYYRFCSSDNNKKRNKKYNNFDEEIRNSN